MRGLINCGRLLLALIPLFLQAQNTSNIFSPYSAYGIGNLSNPVFAPQAMMGRTSVAEQPVAGLNLINPASLAFIANTTFDIGSESSILTYRSETSKTEHSTSNLSYVALGFPLGKKAGLGISLQPYSTVGFKYATSEEKDNIGTIDYTFLAVEESIKPNSLLGINF